MTRGAFVAGDWGTTRLRLFLCDEHGHVIEERHGPGVAAVHGGFDALWTTLVADWNASHGELPAILCGMVGSTIGWTEVAYVPCPARPEKLADAACEVRDHLCVVPGLICENRLGAPDVMRGEETQVLGAIDLVPALRSGRHLMCLPGTHTKWVVLQDGEIVEFLTAPSGEIFDVVRRHSVLVRDGGGAVTVNAGQPEFLQAVEATREAPQASLIHRLFECRSRQLAGQITSHGAAAYLSGLIIGADVFGAMRLFADSNGSGSSEALNRRAAKEQSAAQVHVIGEPALAALYASVLGATGRDAHSIDGEAAALAGLVHLHSLMKRDGVTRAS
jgi:2-dehydro-3-deoxygalactonokinase